METVKFWKTKIGSLTLIRIPSGRFRLIYKTKINEWMGEVWSAENSEQAILMVEASGAKERRKLGKIKPFRRQLSLF